LSEYLKSFGHVKFIDITKFICPNNYCDMKLNTSAMYIDLGHLSLAGAGRVTEEFISSLGLNLK